MVKHAQSDRVKKLDRTDEHDVRLADAVEEYREEQLKPPGQARRGYRPIAEKHDVNHNTLQRAVTGATQVMSDFNSAKQRLTPAEERILVSHCSESANIGFPLTHTKIAIAANKILERRVENVQDFEKVGRSWTGRFLDRNRHELSMHWSKPLDMQRAKSLNPIATAAWYALLKKEVIDLDTPEELIYGMDEVGMGDSDDTTSRVVGARGTKTQHKQNGGSKKNTTVLVTICADGTHPRPAIIFEGQNQMQKWRNNTVAQAQ
jgi:hypothetical protein